MTVRRLTTIELQKEDMKFSAGHFTIFSSTERESLHGHNYQVAVSLTNWIGEAGLSYDYRIYKDKIRTLCKHLDQTFLLAQHSPYCRVDKQAKQTLVYFHDEVLTFLNRDITLLPVKNITVEELSHWFITQLTQDEQLLQQHQIEKILVKIYSGPGQSGATVWER